MHKVNYIRANKIDTDRIMKFMSENVGKNHVYAVNKDFFLYEFLNDDSLNILMAEDPDSKEIYGLYGYYIYSSQEEGCDMAGGISQVSSECRIPLIGTALYGKLKEFYNVRSIVSVGMNKGTSYEINRRRKDTYLGKLSHFYMLSEKDDFRIAVVCDKTIVSITEKKQDDLVLFVDADHLYSVFDESHFKDRLPYKDRQYIEHRYFNHPVYKYQLYGIEDKMVLVCREVSANGAKVLRIVDVLGDASMIRHAGKGLQELLKDNDYEYIDFMEYGMDESDVLAAGFVKLDPEGSNIIPNYFEPFEQRNIEVLCCASLRPALIFKADADQDRPSIIQ